MNSEHPANQLLRDRRGAAMIEGVIVMPLFIAVLAAIVHLHSSYAAKLDANVQARSCAWAYSIAGCTGKTSLPKGCNVEGLGDGKNGLRSIGSAVGMSGTPGRRAGALGTDGALAGASHVGVTLLGLREGIVAKPHRTVSVPSILGGGKRAITGNYSVMCNEREMTSLELAKYAYCSFGDLPGCAGQ